MIKYADYSARVTDTAQEGKLREALMVPADRLVEWHMLKKGRLGVVSGDMLYILPADEAEPIW